MSQLPDFFIRYEVPSDADERSIKRAYAKVLKTIDQETQAQAFQELRDLYEQALGWIQYRDWQIEQERLQTIEDEASLDETDIRDVQSGAQTQDAISHDAPISATTPVASDNIEINHSQQLEHTPAVETITENTVQDGIDANLTTEPQVAEPEAYLPAVLANEVFAELELAFANSEPKQEVALLNACLDDERLIDLEARDIFEWFVIRHIAQGWCHPNGDLFDAAVEVFGWDKDSRRLQRFDEPGQIVDRALTEYAIFQQIETNAETQKKINELIAALRKNAPPTNAFLKCNINTIVNFSNQYPTYLHLNANAENLANWITLGEKYIHVQSNQTLANVLNQEPQSSRPIFYALFVLAILFAFLVGMTDNRRHSSIQANEDPSVNQYKQALLYLNGGKNVPKALQLLESNTRLGHSESIYKLGELYLEGKHLPQDLMKGKELLEKAGNNGLIQAQISLGQYHQVGQYFKKNLTTAFHWYLSAANKGDYFSQDRIAWMYYDGVGTKSSVKEALYWWDQASKNGLLSSSSILGYHYLYGARGVEVNEKRGFELIKHAAQNKDLLALILMGDIFKDGLAGIPKNSTYSEEWYANAKNEIVAQRKSIKHLCKFIKRKGFCST
jgi:hypothetical protein